MKCRILREPSTNQISKVLAPNGVKSELYDSILQSMPDSIELDPYLKEALKSGRIKDNTKSEMALGIYSKLFTRDFEKWFDGNKDKNGEPIISPWKLIQEGNFKLKSPSALYSKDDSEINQIDPTLERKLTSLMNKLGIDIKKVEEINTIGPVRKNIYGRAKLVDNIIELTKNQKGRNALPEEAAHLALLMMGENSQIVQQMLSNVSDFEIYQQVKENYGDLKDERGIRMEATAQLIAKHLINSKPLPKQQRNMLEDWWSRFLRLLGIKLSKVDTQELKEGISQFEMFANEMLDWKNSKLINPQAMIREKEAIQRLDNVGKKFGMDPQTGIIPKSTSINEIEKELRSENLSHEVKETSKGFVFTMQGNKVNPQEEWYNLENGPTQQEIINKYLEDSKRLRGKTEVNGKERYLLDTGVLEGRVSDSQKDIFEKRTGKKSVDINESPFSKTAASVGTTLHDYLERLANSIIATDPKFKNLSIGDRTKDTSIPPRPSIISDSMAMKLYRSQVKLLESFQALQETINPDGQAVVFTEQFVLDEKNNKGGSKDLSVVYSDGSVENFDYKFINFTKTKDKRGRRRVGGATKVSSFKEMVFDMLMTEYKRIDTDVYGITKHRRTRILPFDMTLGKDGDNFTGKVTELNTYEDSKEDYLLPIPVAKEISENEKINQLLSELYKQEDKVTEAIRKNYRSNPDRANRLLTEKARLKTGIQKIQVLSNFQDLVDSVEATVRNMNDVVEGIDIDNIDDLNQMYAEANLLESILKLINNIEGTNIAEEDMETVVGKLGKAKALIDNKRNNLLYQINPNLVNEQTEIDWLRRNFSYLSQIDHPAFNTANELLKTVEGNVQRAVKASFDELEEKTEALRKWAKSQGMTLWDAFDMLISSEHGTLVNKMSKEFYQQKKKAREEGNIVWLKENHKIKEGARDRYLKEQAEEVKFLKSKYDPKGAMFRKLMEDWEIQNDLWNSPEAWTNKWTLLKYTDIVNEERFYSREYKEISKNKELLDYYNWYMDKNRELNQLVGEKIDANFIANIRKSAVETYSDHGGVWRGSKKALKDLKDSFTVSQGGMLSEDYLDADIPLMYYSNLMKENKDGTWEVDVENKSKNLSSSMQLFMKAVYQKHQLEKVRGIIDALQIHVANQDVIETDALGRAIIDPITKKPKKIKSSKTAEIFGDHMKAMVLGERLQNKDQIMFDKLSMNSTISNVMTFFSANTLALNYVSALGNVGAGTMNAYIKGASGYYFNNKQLTNAIKLKVSRRKNDLFNHMTAYFNIESRNWNRKLADKLSASKISGKASVDKAFMLWQKGDSFVSDIVMMAMADNYGVNPETGEVERLALLPENTKSIRELFEVNGDSFESNLTNEQYDDFRRKVAYISRQIKGSNTTEELSKAQMTVFGKMYMFFKNWLPPMASERFGAIKWTEDLKEFEYGRYRAVSSEMFKGYFLKRLPIFLVNLSQINKISESRFEKEHQRFLERNPNMKGKMDVHEYAELKKRTIREGLYEMRMITGLLLTKTAMAKDWDDDGEKDYKKTVATNELYKLLRRMYLELSFFSNPISVSQIMDSPFPILKLGTDIINVINNTSDEAWDRLWGLEDEEIDETPAFHYTKRFTGIRYLFSLYDEYHEMQDEN